MEYQKIVIKLQAAGYLRVERDDRLLDIFPLDTRRYGIELWEKWVNDKVYIFRLHSPFSIKKTNLYSILQKDIELSLQNNTPQELLKLSVIASGQEALDSATKKPL